jgi:hypothetical protein
VTGDLGTDGGVRAGAPVAVHDPTVGRGEEAAQVELLADEDGVAPAGSEQSPPSSARNPRSASTHRRVGACSIVARSRRSTASSSRHSIARAACATCGSITSTSSRSAMWLARPRRSSAVAATTMASWSAALASLVCHVAPQLHEAQVRAGRRAGPCRRFEPVATSAPTGRSARVEPTRTSRGSPRSGTAASTRPGTVTDGRSLAECTARSARPSSTAACTSLANTPLPPSSQMGVVEVAGRGCRPGPARPRGRGGRPAAGRRRARSARSPAGGARSSPGGRSAARHPPRGGERRPRGRRGRAAPGRGARPWGCRRRP